MIDNLGSLLDSARHSLDVDGFVRLEGVVSAEWLASARQDVDRYLSEAGPGDHEIASTPDRWRCPVISSFAGDSSLEAFLESLTTRPPGGRKNAEWVVRVLRILDGTGSVHSRPYFWHYDTCAVTMVIPIVAPGDGSGQLTVFPNSRPHRRWAILSAVEQLVVQTQWYRKRSRRRFDENPSAHTIPIVPTEAYLFRGYRSLHGTLPWTPSTLRVTLVLQYGYPYGPETAAVRAARASREALRTVGRSLRTVRHAAT